MRRILSLLLWAAVLPSCGKTGLQGTAVRFIAASGVPVRASFSGDVSENGVERIDWEKEDLIRIVSPQAVRDGNCHWADYRINGVRNDGASSFATVEPAGAAGLSWGEGAHDFYAVSPASEEASLEGNVYDGFVPAGQTLDWEGPEGMPDKSLICLLAAARGIEASRDEPVSLLFRPAFTALSFTLSLEDDNPVPIHAFRLESTGGPLAGAFRVTMADEWLVETPGETVGAVSIDLDRTLEKGTSLTFTVLCVPLDLSGLKAVFETAYGTKSLTLSRKDGAPIVFPACQKARIKGLVLPGAPDVSFTVDLAPWNEAREEIEAETIENE